MIEQNKGVYRLRARIVENRESVYDNEDESAKVFNNMYCFKSGNNSNEDTKLIDNITCLKTIKRNRTSKKKLSSAKLKVLKA